MPSKEEKSHQLLNEFTFLRKVSKLTIKELISYVTVIAAIYLGAVGSYMLGITLGLPWPVATLLNNDSVIYLTGQLTFMLVVALALFKISEILSAGMFFGWHFLICKFYLGPKRPRGLRNPAVYRIHKRLNSSIVEDRAHVKSRLVIRTMCVGALIFFIFFRTSQSHKNLDFTNLVLYNYIGIAGFMGILGFLASHRVADKISHLDFAKSPQGRRLIIVSTLFFCMMLGIWKINSVMYGPTLHYSVDNKSCRLTSIIPVHGGDLFLDHDSLNFVILSSGKAHLYIPMPSSPGKPSCM